MPEVPRRGSRVLAGRIAEVEQLSSAVILDVSEVWRRSGSEEAPGGCGEFCAIAQSHDRGCPMSKGDQGWACPAEEVCASLPAVQLHPASTAAIEQLEIHHLFTAICGKLFKFRLNTTHAIHTSYITESAINSPRQRDTYLMSWFVL